MTNVKVCSCKSVDEALIAANQYIEALTDSLNDILRNPEVSLSQLRGMMKDGDFTEAPIIRFVTNGSAGSGSGLDQFGKHLVNIARQQGKSE